MTVTIRRARVDDAHALTALCLRSKQSQGYDDAFMAACADELTVTPKQIAEDILFLAETPALAGCAALRQTNDPTTAEVKTFFIDPDHQKQGVGRILWAHLLDAAKSCGTTRLVLDADPGAEGFYKKLGFETIGRAPSGAIPGRFLPHMTRAVDP